MINRRGVLKLLSLGMLMPTGLEPKRPMPKHPMNVSPAGPYKTGLYSELPMTEAQLVEACHFYRRQYGKFPTLIRMNLLALQDFLSMGDRRYTALDTMSAGLLGNYGAEEQLAFYFIGHKAVIKYDDMFPQHGQYRYVGLLA